MKKMKKLLCMILALMFVLSLATTALADTADLTPSDGNGSKDVDITANVGNGKTDYSDAKIYKVTLKWTVTAGSVTLADKTFQWNPETLKYDKDISTDTDAVTNPSISITVTNYSNDAVAVSISEKAGSSFALPAVDTDNDGNDDFPRSLTLASAAPSEGYTGTGTAVTKSFSDYELEITASSFTTGSMTLGAVTVTIAPYVATA